MFSHLFNALLGFFNFCLFLTNLRFNSNHSVRSDSYILIRSKSGSHVEHSNLCIVSVFCSLQLSIEVLKLRFLRCKSLVKLSKLCTVSLDRLLDLFYYYLVSGRLCKESFDLLDYVDEDEMVKTTKKLDNLMDWNVLNQNNYQRIRKVLGE